MTDGYNIWTVERKPVSVHLRESIAARIRQAANAPQQSGVGLERGGILWGRVRNAGEEYYLISIEHAEVLGCDHSDGEGWLLSEKDRRFLRKRLKEGYGDLQCVGYWRTHQRPGLYLDARDLDLMGEFFKHPWCVALCVRPPSTAGFFLWENGDIHRTSSYQEFELPDGEQPEAVPVSRPAPLPWRRWAAAAAVAVLLIAAPFLLRSTSSTDTPFNMLSMRAETEPGLVRLRWDPRSKVLEDANGAVMWIADGVDESKLELTREQLRSGTLDYRPAGGDINFRMEIGPFTESLRVAGIPTRASDGTTTAAQASQDATNETTTARLTPRSAKRLQEQQAADPVAPPPNDPPSASAQPSTPESPKEAEVPPPPQLALNETKLERPPIPSRAPEVPRVIASVETPGSSPFKKAFGWIPGIRKKAYTPAKVVRQVQPRVVTERDTLIAVRVAIDPKGVVKDADLLTKGVDGHLGRSAVEAAKRWRFEPARADNRPVASDMVVRFRFGATRNN